MAAMAVSQSLTSKDAAGAAMYKVPMQEKDMQALHEQLLRERSERQRAAQLCKAQEEELKRRERLNSSLWEQRVRLERDASELRGKLARAESQQQKEVHDLTLQLRRCEALHARETSELQREVVRDAHEHNASAERRVTWLGGLFRRDSPLTALGQRQAKMLGEAMRSEESHPLRQVEVVISSPLSRAIETSLLIFGESMPPARCISPLHTERCIFPCDTGRCPEELLKTFGCLASWEGFSQLAQEWWPKDRSFRQELSPGDRASQGQSARVFIHVFTFSEIIGNLVTGFKNMVGLIASDSKFRMAIVLHEKGKWQEAEKMNGEVLEVRSRVLGEDHPTTLSCKNNLANVFQDQGKWEEAEKMHREVLEVSSGVLGEEHPDILRSKNNLAIAFEEQGKWEEAEKMHGEVLEVMSRVLGEEHPNTLSSMEGLAGTVAFRDREDWQFRFSLEGYSHSGRLLDSVNKLRTSIAARTLRVDDEHPKLLRRRVDLAEWLIQMNEESELKEAEGLLRQTVPALQRRYGFKDSLTLWATGCLVFLLEGQGKDAEEWRQHLPHIEEKDMAIVQENLEDCEDPEAAEMLRNLLAKPRWQIEKVDRSSASSSTPATAQDAASAPIAPSQGLQVVSEAASKSDRASDVQKFKEFLAQRPEAVLAVALHQAALETSRRQLTQARQNGKDREALEEEIQELRGELTQARREMQVRLREQEAEFQKQCLELKTSRLEEEKRRERLEERRPPDAAGLGNPEISKIEGSLEEVSTLSEGAAEAVNKMKLLEDQLRSWQGIPGMENGKSVIHDASETDGSEEIPRSMSKAKVKEVAYQREAELLLEMQQEHLLTIRLNRQAIEARRAAEFRLVRSASLPNSLLDLMRSPPETSKQAVSAVSASVLPRSESCLRPKLEASPNSAGAVLGSTRSNGGNISASGSPPREMSIAVVREEAKEPSPCSCQALSPAPSLEAATAERPEPPDVEHAGRVPECPFDFGIDRCQSSSPTRAAAGRLPPLAGVEKAPEGGRIGLIADLSPSRRPEVDLGVPPAAVQSAREEVEALPDSLDARLKEAELERASWRRRTLLLEEQMQRLLEQQSSKAEARWRPQALQLEETSEEEEAWKLQKQTLEAQLAQALAERDRMIEATNELRADVRRLTGPKQKSAAGPAVLREVPVPVSSDQIIEGQIVDDEGKPNGNVLILIKRIYTPGELGRFVLADYISASAADFRKWIESDDGKVSQIDGSYHFCKVESKSCTAVSSLDICVHVGKWRVWKEDELINKGISEFRKAGNLLISRFFKKDPSQPTPPGHLPWEKKSLPGDLKVGPGGGKKKDEKMDRGEDGAGQGMIQKALAVEGRRRKAISQLEKQLAELKKNVGAEDPAGGRKLLSVDWGGDDDGSDESEDSSSDSGESDDEEPGEGDDPKKPGGGKKGTLPEKKKVKKKDKRGKKDKKKKEKKSKRKKKKKKQKLEKDKGPFGVGESQRMAKDKSSSEDDSSEDSDESSQSFRKAPSGLTLAPPVAAVRHEAPGQIGESVAPEDGASDQIRGGEEKAGKPSEGHALPVEVIAEEEALPSEPEVKTPENPEEPGEKISRFEKFGDGLVAAARHGMPVLEAGAVIWKNIEKLHTPLGKFKEELARHAVAQSGPAVPFDILPISLEGVEDLTTLKWPHHEWVLSICLVLNYQYCAGFGSEKYLRHLRTLTVPQKELVMNHLLPAVCRLAPEDKMMAKAEEVKAELERKGHDGYGSTWVMMETLDKDKVIACWPEATHAAVAPIERFLTGETLEQIQKPMDSILPPEEWPKEVPKSYVRADDETWTGLVKEGLARGLFQVCPEGEILRSPSGEKILNGAGGVPKIKGGEMKQRFISIFCPLNAVSRKLEGSEDTLPYVGQVALLNIPNEAEVLVDSEDMASAFNLFRMPEGWRGLFVYEKTAKDLGLPQEGDVFISLRTIPMGWLSAVGVVQSAIRFLAFKIAGLPKEKEVRKWKEMLAEERFLLYLDSVDQLRLVSKTMAKVLEGEASREHEAFSQACDKMGLPRNQSKTLAGALHGSLQGGELLSQLGVFMLQPEKMLQMNVAMAYYLLTQEKWGMRETTGLVGRLVFAAAFRRPLLAVMEELFTLFTKGGQARVPPARSVDELPYRSG
eukprot:symbB.v1.2.019267.t1/scaffold1509.1/size114668/2